MIATFVDTSFLIALLRQKDAHHRLAVERQRTVNGPILTTEYVLLEFVDAMCSPPVRALATQAVTALFADPNTQVVSASTALMQEGLRLFTQHQDKRWSLTDCISFVVMARERVTDALTSDHHFEQAGFKALLRSPPAG